MVKHISYPTVQIDSNSTVFASTTLYRDKPFVSTSNNVPDLYSLVNISLNISTKAISAIGMFLKNCVHMLRRGIFTNFKIYSFSVLLICFCLLSAFCAIFFEFLRTGHSRIIFKYNTPYCRLYIFYSLKQRISTL